jgi:hypothetical protein
MASRCSSGAAVDFNPSQRRGMGIVKAVEQTLQFGGTDRQKVARTPIKQAIGVEQLHRIASRRRRQRQCGDIESVAESVVGKLGACSSRYFSGKRCVQCLTGRERRRAAC